jgi:hypothetical protein
LLRLGIMKQLSIALLTALLGLSGIAAAGAQQYPYPQDGQYGQYGQNGQQQHGRGHRHNRNAKCNQRNGYGAHDNDDNDNDGDNGERYNNGNGNGYGYGRANRTCANANGGYGNSPAVVRGTIVSVNGDVLTIAQSANNGQYGEYGGPAIRIDDQPALDTQQTGRVAVGRFVTAYGYWQNGTFFATRLV